MGKGDEALFWEDSWDGYPSIDSMGFPKISKEQFIKLWGTKVSDYKTKKTTNGVTNWEWKFVDNLDMDPAVKKAFEKKSKKEN